MPNPEITNFDTGSLVLKDGEYSDITLNAPGAVTYPEGQVLAYDAAAAKWKITKSGTAAVANAKAILSAETEFTGAGDKLVRAAIGGTVDQNFLVFDGADTIDTIPAGAADSFGLQLRDYGILAIDPANLTAEDNQ
jgi:phage baseplate assembly protein gpV